MSTAIKLKDACSLGEKSWKPRQNNKYQKHHFAGISSYNQSYGFSVVLYGCESWTIKRAENQRIDDFKLWSWRRFLRVPWTARRSNQSILKEINLDYSLQGLNAEVPILWPPEELTHWKRSWCSERMKARGEEGSRRWDDWMASPTNGHEFKETLREWRTRKVDMLQSMGCKVLDMT